MSRREPKTAARTPPAGQYRDALEQKKAASMGQLLLKASRLYNERAIARVRDRTGAERLTVAHTTVLPHLDLEGTRLTTLAERMNVSKQFVGQLLEELESLGVVERVPDPTDGRAKLVRFTAKGKRALLQGLDVLGEIERSLVEVLGRDRADAFTETLSDVIGLLDGGESEPAS